MPFCPQCHYEYRPEISVCPDCNERLVTTLPDPQVGSSASSPGDAGNWIALVKFTSHEYAEMIVESFKTKGIDAVIYSGAGFFGKISQTGLASSGLLGGGFSILVDRDKVQEADLEGLALLGELWVDSRLINIDHW